MKKSLLLLLAMAMTMLPIPSDEACGVVGSADSDPCSTPLAYSCNDQTCCPDQGHSDDNCCEPGCQNCSLPCCTGTVMIPALVQTMDVNQTPDGRLAATSTGVCRTAADQPFHPPRA